MQFSKVKRETHRPFQYYLMHLNVNYYQADTDICTWTSP